VTAWKLLTGGLHLDGLADCLDGLVGRDREHRLAIMRDSRIGTFGAVGLILFLMLEIVAVGELPPALRWRALIVVPTLARAVPPVLAPVPPHGPPALARRSSPASALGQRRSPWGSPPWSRCSRCDSPAHAGDGHTTRSPWRGFIRRLGGLTGDARRHGGAGQLSAAHAAGVAEPRS
jgi:adenosylcobinamide-GDP ribazoletransferase